MQLAEGQQCERTTNDNKIERAKISVVCLLVIFIEQQKQEREERERELAVQAQQLARRKTIVQVRRHCLRKQFAVIKRERKRMTIDVYVNSVSN